MTIKTDLSVMEYYTMVNDIALEYFSEDGEYQPHIGRMNAMRLFYNKCVTESEFDEQIPHDNIDAMAMEPLFANRDFIESYNEAISGNGLVCLNFAYAYRDAMEIVNTKKTSLSHAVDMVKKSIGEIVDMLSPALSESNISAISAIAQNIANGNITSDSIVEAYARKLQNEANEEITTESIEK